MSAEVLGRLYADGACQEQIGVTFTCPGCGMYHAPRIAPFIARFIANHQPRPRGVAEAAALMRAALLDALGGTTPPLDETGGKA